ncbi:aminodeoxychorismate lyase [Ferrimonas marina]|uniref:Aminodeoxychorismate lyase n=1 Tax=Ferrimonas marina TaxID=299255 RepID=A0A1M5NI86_9GAMM|nr:aminodeoxychorismate lyase [Ferrimonas marina]SHG89238.1 4-amino-4-deoxychorismate lyase [Ferrimonas marina]
MKLWVDGQPQGTLAADDRGLTLADGHFTTMRVAQGQVCLWPLHRQRLTQTNRLLGLAQPDWAQVEAELKAACAEVAQGCLRLTLTRGSAGRGYQGQFGVTPRRVLALSEYPSHYASWQRDGIRAAVAHQRLAQGGALVGHKTLGRTEQVLLKREAQLRQLPELVVLSQQGEVIEATAGNLFVWLDGQWHTPALSHCGIAGVMRQHLLSLLPSLGLPVRVAPLSVAQLKDCQAAFISNCLMGLVPLIELDGRPLPIHPTIQTITEAGTLWR